MSVDCVTVPPKSSDAVFVFCIPPGSELEDPSLGVIPVGHPGFFASEEANGVGLEKGIVVYKRHIRCDLSSDIYLKLHIPHASNSKNMQAIRRFMVFNVFFH